MASFGFGNSAVYRASAESGLRDLPNKSAWRFQIFREATAAARRRGRAIKAAERRRLHCQVPDACAAKGAGLCRSCHYKALSVDPAFAAAHRARSSARMKALHVDPAFAAAHRARCSARMKALHADPAFAAARRARCSAHMKALHADPAFAAARRARCSARMEARRAALSPRSCLRCGKTFANSGPDNRICRTCKPHMSGPGRAFEGVT